MLLNIVALFLLILPFAIIGGGEQLKHKVNLSDKVPSLYHLCLEKLSLDDTVPMRDLQLPTGATDPYMRNRLIKTFYGKVIHILQGHERSVNSISFNEDGTALVTASSDRTIRLWDSNSEKKILIISEGEIVRDNQCYLRSSEGIVDEGWIFTNVQFSPRIQPVQPARNKDLILYRNNPLQWIMAINHYKQEVRIWCLERLSAKDVNRKQITWLNFGSGRMCGHGDINRALFSHDGNSVGVASGWGSVEFSEARPAGRVWSFMKGGNAKFPIPCSCEFLKVGREAVTDILFVDNDTKVILAYTDGKIRIFNISGLNWDDWDVDHQEVLILDGHSAEVNKIESNPYRFVLASASYDRTVRLWNYSSGEEIKTLEHYEGVEWLEFSPDGEMLATASRDGIRIWNLGSLELCWFFKTNKASQVKFNRDGRIVASAIGNTINLWESKSGELLKILEGHSALVNDIEFSQDGKMLASASSDGTGRLWDVDMKWIDRMRVVDYVALKFLKERVHFDDRNLAIFIRNDQNLKIIRAIINSADEFVAERLLHYIPKYHQENWQQEDLRKLFDDFSPKNRYLARLIGISSLLIYFSILLALYQA